jgi:(4-(4-[2-(gamma-L-glutamylamino)ethyl]phenoxymethyl)furan-2-yl)methanamine synthase
MQSIIGWDIGGAHLKAARLEAGRIVDVVQIASPLWLGLSEVDRAFTEAKAALGPAERNAVTMTAELSDMFADRQIGVVAVAEIANRELAPQKLLFYAGDRGFIAADAVADNATAIASANWHASAALAARHVSDGLFVDTGSTTTDIIPICAGSVAARGHSDPERMAYGELVYAGVVRSFLMAGLRLVPFAGRWVPLMNEWFANASDVYRILGELPEGADQMATADGQPKTTEASRVRLARQIGYDAKDVSASALVQLARFFAEAQLREITDGVYLALSHCELDAEAPVIGAGVGRFVVKRLAERLARPYVDFDEMIPALPEIRKKAGDCVSACAVALLAAAQS